MPRIPGTTNAQTLFLRAFRHHPAGPPPEAWPSPAILRRWLQRPAFLEALDAIRAGLRLRTDLHLTAAAVRAAQQLQTPPAPDSPQGTVEYRRSLSLLRLAHLRETFSVGEPDDDAHDPAIGVNLGSEGMT
jgi:hypothetical protein